MTRSPSAPRTTPQASPSLLVFFSACLLILAFPSFNQPWTAWIALVPWLWLLPACTPREAFRYSWQVGCLFFLGSMWWLIELGAFGGVAAVVGWAVLAAYLGVYFGLFGWLTRRVLAARPAAGFRLLIIPALWVGCEYLRGHLLTGQPWNLLGYSQSPWLAAIQIADLTGAWGVSFVVVLVNVGIVESLKNLLGGTGKEKGGTKGRLAGLNSLRPLAPGLIAAAVVLSVVGYGHWRLRHLPGGTPLRVSVIQANIPQAQKWDEQYAESILERHEALTREAAQEAPDLIVWPEASVPGVIGIDDEVTKHLQVLAREIARPLLVGAPMVRVGDAHWRMTNSAALLDAQGQIVQRYDKIHLVVFGEYIPFEKPLPWLRDVLPPIGDFVPGRSYEVFKAAAGDWDLPPFSVLVCFEDVFPELARRFARQGAQALLTITNDAWFGPTAAAYQHAQASTLRAVELHRPVVRAANTG